MILSIICGIAGSFFMNKFLKIESKFWLFTLIGGLIGFLFGALLGILGISTSSLLMVLGSFIMASLISYIIHVVRNKSFSRDTNKAQSSSNVSPKDDFKNFNKDSVKIVEAKTTYESIGNEERVIDNSTGNGNITRRIKLSKSWKKSIDYSNSEFQKKATNIKLAPYFLSLKSGIEHSLNSRYSIHEEAIMQFSEEIEIEIKPYTKMVVNIEWKRVWQNGTIEFSDLDGNHYEQPYKVSKGILFDQVQKKQ